jgi:predicted transposase YbfD/YdcC
MNKKHAYTRAAGSQSEIPHLRKRACGALKVSGYQNFTLNRRAFTKVADIHKQKYQLIRPYLRTHDKDITLADIGCSAGVIGLHAVFDGYANVTFIDHDWEYIELVKNCLNFIGAKSAKALTSSLKDLSGNYDIGFAFAIIHWIYSYSEQMGSLEKAIELLNRIARKSLFIEWVSPNDNAIKLAEHISQHKAIIEEPY